ncbi:unnamed protein product [Microthlaspi erraticum]|uniref:Uncharacterized protein n=1 Tax=Microthlaspi erraticum TaxID=1685480 RepID=A0A6D2HM92_9BRAS|nr:unnamed protein product [Microthlaspi erraticum]
MVDLGSLRYDSRGHQLFINRNPSSSEINSPSPPPDPPHPPQLESPSAPSPSPPSYYPALEPALVPTPSDDDSNDDNSNDNVSKPKIKYFHSLTLSIVPELGEPEENKEKETNCKH